nr:MAG TPA: hypothetical protein [Caudoviricetes sp.]
MVNIKRYCIYNDTHEGDNVFNVYKGYPLSSPFVVNKVKGDTNSIKVKNNEILMEKYEKYFYKSMELNQLFKDSFYKIVEKVMENNGDVYIATTYKDEEECYVDFLINEVRKTCLRLFIKSKIKKSFL